MASSAPRPSARLIRAAAAERAELARHRERMLRERESLRAELDRVEDALDELEDRRRLLDRLTPRPATDPATGENQMDARGAEIELRGPAIREAAVRLLVEHPERPEAMHYREWFGLLRAAGYSVTGKDPLAVFLTQLSRSPALRKGTQAGVYELDHRAPANLRRRLEELHGEMRELTGTSAPAADLAAIRARRADLAAEIGRVERAVEEVERLLGTHTRPALAAAG